MASGIKKKTHTAARAQTQERTQQPRDSVRNERLPGGQHICVCSSALSTETTRDGALERGWTGCAVCLAEFRASVMPTGTRSAGRQR